MTSADAPAAATTRAPASGTSTLVRHRIEHVDTDASGVVHFSRYASLMESVVLDHLEDNGAGLAVLAELGADLAVTDLQVHYRRPAVYRDPIVGEAVVKQVGGARFRVAATLLREETDGSRTELASGAFTFAAVHPTTGGAVPLPPAIRHTLKGIASDAARPDRAAGASDGTGRAPAAGPAGVR